jgi:hypothetical protein
MKTENNKLNNTEKMCSLIQRNTVHCSKFAGLATEIRYLSELARMDTERLNAAVTNFIRWISGFCSLEYRTKLLN